MQLSTVNVSLFLENNEEVMSEHPLALANGNADIGLEKIKMSCCKYSAYILYGATRVSSGLQRNDSMISV